ncbi:MAG: hypothetical protein LAKADJCE_00872 [Candidatus Argoarchaeum ethanivorans]|uniref:DUF4878 domain-containing protein n=1 Tax=Candidatus Argoarchaeum ethanivorans TaxID=2608793 RepID=A0A811TFZ0_9EURY|nr:MAG: hypothetical protein LAKADJCE_00872 [Candidatus Argoarchaeum ethanivorans]
MLKGDNIIGKVKIAILIGIVTVAVMGCLSSDAPPSEVVETFAAWHEDGEFGNCYFLMSEEYKNSTDKSTFEEKMSQCKPAFPSHYEFVKVRRPEKIEGNSASVEIVYVTKKDFPHYLINNLINKPENITKTINLIKEEGGWRLTDLHCELKGK